MFGKQWLFRTAQRTGMSQGVREKMDLLAEGRWSGQSHVLISVYDTAFWFALYLLFPHLWIWLMCNTMHISRGCRVVISSSHRVNSCHNISTPKKDSKNKKQQQQEKKKTSLANRNYELSVNLICGMLFQHVFPASCTWWKAVVFWEE